MVRQLTCNCNGLFDLFKFVTEKMLFKFITCHFHILVCIFGFYDHFGLDKSKRVSLEICKEGFYLWSKSQSGTTALLMKDIGKV